MVEGEEVVEGEEERGEEGRVEGERNRGEEEKGERLFDYMYMEF